MRSVLLLLTLGNLAGVFSTQLAPFEVREINRSTGGPETRIYGGLEAPEGKFPFMIFVLMKMGDTILSCSASLVRPEWVLLAGHCVRIPGLTPDNIILAGGKANLQAYINVRLSLDFNKPIAESIFGVQERRAKAFYIHPKYNENTFDHDTALIKVTDAFALTSVQTIDLSKETIPHRSRCTILGWGLTKGNIQTFKLNYAENKEISTVKQFCEYKKTGAFICLLPDNRGICQGDSGSPLVCNGMVWGVASHMAIDPNIPPNCGTSLEEYYTELSVDYPWIESVFNGGPSSAVFNWKSLLVGLAVTFWMSFRQ